MRLSEITSNIQKINSNTYSFSSNETPYTLSFNELAPRVAEVAFVQNGDSNRISNTGDQGQAAISIFKTVSRIIKDELPNYDQLEFSTTSDRTELYQKIIQNIVRSSNGDWEVSETSSGSSDKYKLFILRRKGIDLF